MKKDLLVLFLAMFCCMLVNAQNYVVDYIYRDSATAHPVIVKADRDSILWSTVGLKLANGEKIVMERTDRTVKGKPSCAIFQKDGKTYAINKMEIVLSDDNPEGTIDPFNTRAEKKHSHVAHVYMTMTPYWIIALLFIVAIIATIVGVAAKSNRKYALIVVPACILAASAIEIGAAYYLGSDAFWWCDKGTYGFWGSLLRAIPLMIFITFQLYSFKLYCELLSTEDKKVEISIKPMVISMAICIPVVVVVAITCALMKFGESKTLLFMLISFIISFGIGVSLSVFRNIKELGKITGLLVSLFSFVYIIGAIIAVYGLIMVLLRLILQILIIVGAIVFIAIALKTMGVDLASSSGGGGASCRTPDYWIDAKGNRHISRSDAERANENIARREAENL